MELNNKNIANGLKTLVHAKYKRLFNKPIKPKVIAYSVTWRCNAKCPMCGLRTMENSKKDIAQELTASDIDRIFKDKSLNSLDLIRFTGGEPFLKEDFTEIIYSIWKNAKPKLFYITTNGTYTERIKKFLEFFKDKDINLNIQVSFDAVSNMHNKIRGIPGLTEKVLSTLEMLSEMKKVMNLNVGINQTIIKENLNEIGPMNQLAKKLGIEHKIYVAVYSHESNILSQGGREFEFKLAFDLSKEEISKLYQKIEYILDSNRKFKSTKDVNYLWHLVEKFLIEGEKARLLGRSKLIFLPCQAAFLYFRLLPNGDIMPCTLIPESIGNVKIVPFSKLWHSKKAESIRKKVKKCPGCWVACDIVSNFVYSNQIIKNFIKQKNL